MFDGDGDPSPATPESQILSPEPSASFTPPINDLTPAIQVPQPNKDVDAEKESVDGDEVREESRNEHGDGSENRFYTVQAVAYFWPLEGDEDEESDFDEEAHRTFMAQWSLLGRGVS